MVIGLRNRQKGFTLFELIIVILLIGLMMMMVIPSVSALDGAELRTSQNTLSGVIADAYGRAALDSDPYRLVVDFESNAYWLEKVSEKSEDEGASVKKSLALGELFSGARSPDDSGSEKKNDKSDSEAFGPSFKPVEDELGEKQVLPKEVYFWGFWTAPMAEWQKKDKAYLYFFPGGQTQRAYIAIGLKDDEEDNLTLETVSLTGKTVILDEVPEI